MSPDTDTLCPKLDTSDVSAVVTVAGHGECSSVLSKMKAFFEGPDPATMVLA